MTGQPTQVASTNQWSDGAKWWADIGKNLVTFLVVSLTTLLVFDHWEDERARTEANRKLRYGYLLSAIDAFTSAASDYSSLTYDLIRTNYQGAAVADVKSKGGQDRKQEFDALSTDLFNQWDSLYDKLKKARLSLKSWATANGGSTGSSSTVVRLAEFEKVLKEIAKLNRELWLEASAGTPRGKPSDWSKFCSMDDPGAPFGSLRLRYASAADAIVLTLLDQK